MATPNARDRKIGELMAWMQEWVDLSVEARAAHPTVLRPVTRQQYHDKAVQTRETVALKLGELLDLNGKG